MNLKRVRKLNSVEYQSGDVVYWMSRDQRVKDNWALIHALQIAQDNKVKIRVVFCLRTRFEFGTERLLDFMLSGLEEVEQDLEKINIEFILLIGEPEIEIPKFVKNQGIGYLVCDFNPLKWNQNWKKKILEKVDIPFDEVDTHNIVPVWAASSKQEYGAYTLRPKIKKQLNEFLEEFPKISLKSLESRVKEKIHNHTDWDQIRRSIKTDKSVPKVSWIKPGEEAAHEALRDFLSNGLADYNQDRNDPTRIGQSELSPYIHFGHLSSQRIALEVSEDSGHRASKEAFLEELIVRKELSDNFCFYNENYDNPKGFPDWAKKTLKEHSKDTREYLYTKQELEKAQTHDDLWNAAQIEMVKRGKMHGYLRMYWAKKIFEWTKNAEEAQKIAIYLNDKYFLDGRDPNGYTGIAWSMGGVHDRAWFERKIFGKIRYMSYSGARGKFSLKEYIEKISNL